MNFKNELAAMQERMFTPELLEEMEAAYRPELEDYELNWETLEEKAVLLPALTAEQKAALLEAEKLCRENISYALRFSFSQGVYAGFEQFFAQEAPEDAFDIYIENQIMTMPGMKRHVGYCQKREQVNDLFAQVEQQLDEETQAHVTDLYSAWDNRLYGVVRYGFYLGFRYAFSTIDTATPLGSKGKRVGKILKMEHALGFLQTLEEQEGEARSRRCLMNIGGAADGEPKNGEEQ